MVKKLVDVKTVCLDDDVVKGVEQFRQEFDADGRIILTFSRAVNYLLAYALKTKELVSQEVALREVKQK